MKPALFTGLLLSLLLAGCGDKPSAANAPRSAEVRGEPIVPKTARATAPSASASASASATVSVSASASGAASALAAPGSNAVEIAPATPTAAVVTTNTTASAFSSAGLKITPSTAAPEYSTNPVDSVAVAAAAGSAKANDTTPGYPLVGFDRLAGYTIEISDELLGPVTNELAAAKAKTEALIPDSVKAYSQKHVSLRGFMLPLKVEGGLVTELLVMKDQSMCCYGTVPKIHEWVSVKMTEKGVKPVMDQPITLFGTLHIGEMRENGYLTGIYRMDGQGMIVPE